MLRPPCFYYLQRTFHQLKLSTRCFWVASVKCKDKDDGKVKQVLQSLLNKDVEDISPPKRQYGDISSPKRQDAGRKFERKYGDISSPKRQDAGRKFDMLISVLESSPSAGKHQNVMSKIKNVMSKVKDAESTKNMLEGKVSVTDGFRRYDLQNGPSLSLFPDFHEFDDPPSDRKLTLHEQQFLKESSEDYITEPQNSFEVMMMNSDREWNFPIDNQQNIGIEEQTGFEDHVFLEHYLDDFPNSEPIQKYMELVITGLQQNPYLSVAQKQERIMFYKSYFEKFPEDELHVEI